MSRDRTVIKSTRRKIENARKALAELGENTPLADLQNIIEGMGNLLQDNGFSRDPFEHIKEEIFESDDETTSTKKLIPVLHDYLENGEPSASNYAGQAIMFAKSAIRNMNTPLKAEDEDFADINTAARHDLIMRDALHNAMRAQHYSTLANMRGTKMEQDLWSGRQGRTVNRVDPNSFGEYADKLSRRKALVEEAKKNGKDPVAYISEKEQITPQGAERYLKNKNLLDN